MNKVIFFIAFITIIFVGLIGAKAFFHPGFYTSHDGEHQLVRQYVFEQGLKDRQIPVRFNRQLYNGYGYPLFFFTYRLPFYLGEIFRFLNFSFADSVKSVFVLTYLASGLTMFVFARRWGNLAGLLAAVIYLWTPYRFSVMFVRAALGEHTALVFFPLILWSLDAKNNSRWKIPLGAAAITGLMLSHAMMAQIFILPLMVWLICQLISNRQPLSDWIKIGILGLGLSSFYFLPAGFYRRLTQQLNPSYFADHFVTVRQLIYSSWGYAFSMPGTLNDGMSFQVGIANWLIIVVSTVFLLVILTFKYLKVLSFIEGFGLLSMFGVSIFLMTANSDFIWQNWKNFVSIDIPWRFLSITTLSSAAAVGWFTGSIKHRPVAIMTLLSLLTLAFYTNRNHLRVNKYIDYPDSDLRNHSGTSNSYNEYRPRWDDVGITQILRPEALISQGTGELRVIESTSKILNLAVKAAGEIHLDINTLYFPGWAVSVDGRQTKFNYSGEGGIMRVDVPSGYHLVEAKFSEPPMAAVGDLISVISFIILIIIIKKP